jgi:ABC-type multidrug transport system ATPase subunit
MASETAVLQAHGLGFGFPKQPALFADWSIGIPPGLTWVGGDESTGKTTLLRLLAGEIPAQSGTLLVNGISIADQAATYRSRVFWVDPRTHAFDALTPQTYWDGLQGQYPAFARELLADLTARFALEPHLEKSLYMLSTGSRRKIFLAAAFASGAALTLLDEPFAALDRASINVVLELLQEAASHRKRAVNPSCLWLQ